MLYREAFIKKLNGIFAIAIYHAEEKRLWLFRDRIGIKPLFFTITDNTLVFASEIKGLFIYPGINPVVDKTVFAKSLPLVLHVLVETVFFKISLNCFQVNF